MRQADLAGDRGGFDVEVVQDLDVIDQEAGRGEHRGARRRAAGQVAQVVADVRPEPRILGPAAAALVDDRVVEPRAERGAALTLRRDQPRRLLELLRDTG